MTFGWIGYLWALLGCGCVGGACFAAAAALYVVGRKADARGPRVVVEAVGKSKDPEEPS